MNKRHFSAIKRRFLPSVSFPYILSRVTIRVSVLEVVEKCRFSETSVCQFFFVLAPFSLVSEAVDVSLTTIHGVYSRTNSRPPSSVPKIVFCVPRLSKIDAGTVSCLPSNIKNHSDNVSVENANFPLGTFPELHVVPIEYNGCM